jgi:hypothetical protein
MKLKLILLEAEMEHIEASLEKEFGNTLRDLSTDAKSQYNPLKQEAASVEDDVLDESIGIIGIVGIVLAMPRVLEILAKPIGKFIKLARKVLKSKAVEDETKVADTILHFAHKWHHGYVKVIKWILEVSGAFKKAGFTSDSQKDKAANLIYYIVIALLAVHSGIDSIHAFKEVATAANAGNISIAALESALASIKTQEVALFSKKLMA